jgi:hypothetical protein
MAGAIYRAEFILTTNSINDEKAPHNEVSNPNAGGNQEELKTKISDNIVKKQDKEKKASMAGANKAIGIGIAATAFVLNQAVNEQLTSMAIQGDSVAARNLQNQKAIANELLGIGGGLAVAALIPGGLAVAAGALAVKYTIKAIDYSREVREHDANVQIDKYLSQQEQNKIQANSREFR